MEASAIRNQEQIPCDGDVCAGDVITFVEGVFGGSFKNPRYLGDREITARVVRDSYGADKQQHTFTLIVISSSGHDRFYSADERAANGLEPVKITRKGRNVYRNSVTRQPWADESARQASLDDKHTRGTAARSARDERRQERGW